MCTRSEVEDPELFQMKRHLFSRVGERSSSLALRSFFPVVSSGREQMRRRKWIKLIYLQIDTFSKASLWIRVFNRQAVLPSFHLSNSKLILWKTHSVKTQLLHGLEKHTQTKNQKPKTTKQTFQYVEHSFEFLFCDSDVAQSHIRLFLSPVVWCIEPSSYLMFAITTEAKSLAYVMDF